ncbi:MAG: ABC transporter ATP-binding protein [Rhodoferax sp.]|uniref:ABC transporter ATP-binding protein n=1 Tax=Rhodoferax sp. TaxID=50421 RepID=UPI002735C98B|nr:ABC transporter ATP-binding protein [Rhodoferax sp.]MDP2678851.1 ABC transporter ATP-binding protein [Rhodoferax sp.]
MSFLKLQGLVKRYGNANAVAEFSLSVNKGEFVCLLGPSGCGKTTTLQMVAGFVQPTSGQILLDGKDITGIKPDKRGLGIVFQSYALFPHMTVSDNIAFGLEMRGIAVSERRQRVGEALELVHLGPMAARFPSELSGGQRQRVAMARALVIKPPVLLLDEPMGALDAKLREEMQIELRALQRRVGITTLMVTHDQAEAMTLADRVVLMNKGQIEQVGRPFDMYERPNGRFSSTFLGKANVFEGTAVGGSVKVNDYCFPCPEPAITGEVAYIVRPEKMEFTDDGALIRGTVTARVFLGNHWLFQIDTKLGTLQLTHANNGLPKAAEGDDVGVTWAAADAHIVPREVTL